MATPTKTPTNSIPANPVPTAAPAAALNAGMPQQAPPAIAQDLAALSAGVQSVMGAEQSVAASAQEAASVAEAVAGEKEEKGESTEEDALVTSSAVLDALEDTGLIERTSVEARLPVQLDVGIPIRDFRVRNLVMLAPGALIESQWVPGEDVPVASADVQLAWSEFEVVDTQLAVRLTRLA